MECGIPYPIECFNPRTHEGCDHLNAKLQIRLASFNPRTHEGCDFLMNKNNQDWQVSIHAPTRGATYGYA